ncbi:KR-domain-containing protein [Lizonia empirigonia]|nr:KR-domain-containing protein [Lizonia empirigonia]
MRERNPTFCSLLRGLAPQISTLVALIRRAAGSFRVHIQATVKSAEQRDELVNELGLPKDAVIISSSAGSSRALFSHILEKTGSSGIDVVVYAGNSFLIDEEVGLCLSDLARIAIVVTPDQPMISLPLLGGNVGLFAVDPLRILTEQPRLVSTLLKGMGVVKIPDTASSNTFTVSELDEAIQTANNSAYDIVSISLLPGSGGFVPEIPILPAALGMPKLDSSATYILAGGLGSLGLRVAELMAGNGATRLVFLSRSGGNRHNSKLKKLHGLGCETLALTCDVTLEQSVIDVVVEVGKTGRPIEGLLQCARVLQDSLFDKMTYDQWQAAFRPKVDGTWNLHTRLPKDMDFFVMLSSVIWVIGNVSQATVRI